MRPQQQHGVPQQRGGERGVAAEEEDEGEHGEAGQGGDLVELHESVVEPLLGL